MSQLIWIHRSRFTKDTSIDHHQKCPQLLKGTGSTHTSAMHTEIYTILVVGNNAEYYWLLIRDIGPDCYHFVSTLRTFRRHRRWLIGAGVIRLDKYWQLVHHTDTSIGNKPTSIGKSTLNSNGSNRLLHVILEGPGVSLFSRCPWRLPLPSPLRILMMELRRKDY